MAGMVQCQVCIPEGAQPGTQFMAGTPDGQQVAIAVPQGCQPGQQITFSYQPIAAQAQPMTAGAAQPMVAGAAYPQAVAPQMAHPVPGAVPMGQPRGSFRVLPQQATSDNLAALEGFNPQRSEKRLAEISAGSELKDRLPPFPASRGCRDSSCALLFLLVAGGVITASFLYTSNITDKSRYQMEGQSEQMQGVMFHIAGQTMKANPAIKEIEDTRTLLDSIHDHLDIRQSRSAPSAIARNLYSSSGESKLDLSLDEVKDFVMVGCGVALSSGLFAVAAVLALSHFVRTNTESMLKWCLCLCPFLYWLLVGWCAFLVYQCSIAGASPRAAGLGVVYAVLGLFFVLIACCNSICGCCVGASGILPINVAVTKAITTVLSQHKGLIAVSMLSFVMWFGWLLTCLCATAGLLLEHEDTLKQAAAAMHYVLFFFAVLIFVWGTGVFSNLAVVAQAGVYGRWHFEKTGPMTMPSVQVALTTSFGPVCFGSLTVAIIRAIEWTAAMLKPDRSDFRENPVMAIILCIVCTMIECIMSLIGDVLEYFNKWAYVQCAVRNASFIEAAKITYAMCTCANIELLLSDLLLDWVTDTGNTLGGFVGFCIGFAGCKILQTAYTDSKFQEHGAMAMPLIGFISGCIAASMVTSILTVGIKTLLVLWAEDPAPLQNRDPAFDAAMGGHIEGKLQEKNEARAQENQTEMGAMG